MHAFRVLPLPIALLIVDRFLKTIVLHTPHPQWGGVFSLHRNQGIAFSIPLPDAVMMGGLGTALVVVMIAFTRESKKQSPHLLPYFFILAGAFSNVFDRVGYRAVIDYVAVPVVGLFFNLADVMILLGIVLLLFRRPPKFFTTTPH